MELVPYLLAYLAIGVFIAAVITRFLMWSKMPMHIRWELYPVAHEPGRASYGGSYLEESEWWKKPREVSLFGELKVMIPEILFLVAVKEHNPKLWVRTFPFHFGIYLVAGCTVLMIGNSILSAAIPSLLAGGLGSLLNLAILACGVGGLGLGLFGAFGLLQRRLSDPGLRDYSSSADIFNLLFFIVAFGFSLVSIVMVDRDFTKVATMVNNLVTFNLVAMPGSGLEALLPLISMILMAALVAYIPMTHMSHFFGKYFAYHAIRWNDKPNLAGGDEESTIQELLNRPITWAAPHIQGNNRTWAEVCTEIPTEEAKK